MEKFRLVLPVRLCYNVPPMNRQKFLLLLLTCYVPATCSGQDISSQGNLPTPSDQSGATAFPGAEVVPAATGEQTPLSVLGDGIPSFWQPGEQIISAEPPLRPAWYNPLGWLGPYWDGTFEIGINGAKGNNNAFSITTGLELSRETQLTNWDLSLVYAKNQSDGVETQHNAILFSTWDYKLPSPHWSWFNKLILEYDEFKEFDLRVTWNTGLGYLLVDTPTTQFRERLGAGVSRELGGMDDDYEPAANFGLDFSHQISERQKFSAVVDFFPNFGDFSDFRIVSDFSWEVLLDEASDLSLKIGVIDRYDSTPNGAEANDVLYTMVLLWAI